MDACFGNHEAGSFRYVIVANAFYSEDRAFVVLNEKNEPIATSNSWETGYVNNVKKGYISFVGVVPSYQGRGLAIHVLNYTLRDIKKRGFDKAVIHVGEFNYPALKTYIKGGFLPVIKKQEEIEHWNNIYRHLSIPIPDYDKTMYPYIESPHPPRPWTYQISREKAAQANSDLFIHGAWHRFNMYHVDKTEYGKLKSLFANDETAQKWLDELSGSETGKIYIDSDVNPQAAFLIKDTNEYYKFGKGKDKRFDEGLKWFFGSIQAEK